MKLHKISKDLTIHVLNGKLTVYSKKLKKDIASLSHLKPKDMDFSISFLTFIYLGTEL